MLERLHPLNTRRTLCNKRRCATGPASWARFQRMGECLASHPVIHTHLTPLFQVVHKAKKEAEEALKHLHFRLVNASSASSTEASTNPFLALPTFEIRTRPSAFAETSKPAMTAFEPVLSRGGHDNVTNYMHEHIGATQLTDDNLQWKQPRSDGDTHGKLQTGRPLIHLGLRAQCYEGSDVICLQYCYVVCLGNAVCLQTNPQHNLKLN
jgi:hypothetical protein